MIAREQPPRGRGPSPGDSQEMSSGLSAERVRQVYAACLLLDAEAKPGASAVPRTGGQQFMSERPHGFAGAVLALAVLLSGGILAVLWLTSRPPIHRVADYRLGIDYTEHEASDAVLSRSGNQLLLATQGGGLHSISSSTRFLRHHSSSSTSGGLLSDDIRRIDRDPLERLYFLCQQQDRLGLCRARETLDGWETLLGINRFEALTGPHPEREVTSAVMVGDVLWLGTRTAGIGRYDVPRHDWLEPMQATPNGLPDNRVRDLATDDQGAVWIATAAGISRHHPQQNDWKHFTVTDGLVGSDVVRLRWLDGALWYATSAGGLGRFDRTGMEGLVSESGWGQHESAELAAISADVAERLWFATHTGDVGRYDPSRRQWFNAGAGPSAGRVQALVTPLSSAADAWLATDRELLLLKAAADDSTVHWQKVLPSGVDRLDAHGSIVAARLMPAADQPFPALSVVADGDEWKTVVGGRSAPSGAKGVLSVDYDAMDQLLWIATERGLARYSTTDNDWTGDFPQPAAAASRIVDLRLLDGAPVVLTANRDVSRLQPMDGKWERLLGGGQFAAAESDMTAVTRDAADQLWIGTQSQGLFVYDTLSHRWGTRLPFPKPIDDLQSSAGAVWLLAGGVVHVVKPGSGIQPLSDKLPEVTAIAAAPHAAGAVLLCRTGHVWLADDRQQLTQLVGDAAPGFDLHRAPAVAVLGDAVVFAGEQPHIYRTLSRSWQKLNVGRVTNLVSALDVLWLHSDKGVIRLAADLKPEIVPKTERVVRLAGASDRLVALMQDGALLTRTKGAADWETLKSPAKGPVASLLTESNWSAACTGDNLYLSGGKDGEAWNFSWTTQQWQPLVGDSGPLKRVVRLNATADSVYALDQTGTLYSGRAGTSQLSKVQDGIVSVQQARGVLTATTASGAVNLHRAAGGQTSFGAALKQPLGELRSAVPALGGIVFAGTEGTAWLSDGLTDWRAMTAPDGAKLTVEEFHGSRDGQNLWAISTQRRLFAFDADAWSWKSVLSDNATVDSATVVHRPDNTSELWACTSAGAVFRVQKQQAVLWSQPATAPGKIADIVGVAAVADGFLIAFANGRLAHFGAVSRTWSELPTPAGQQQLLKLVALGAEAEGSCLLWSRDGAVYRSPLKSPPQWTSIATGVTSLTRQGSAAWAIASQQRQLMRIDAQGTTADWLKPAGRIDAGWGPLTSAAEIALPNGGTGLVLGFAAQLAAYDPASHSWFAQAMSVKTLSPVAGGVLVVNGQGEVALGKFAATGLTVEPLTKGSRITAVSGKADVSNWLTLEDSGRVSLREGTKALKDWIGRSWPGDPAQTQIVDVATVGHWFLLLDSQGNLSAYDRTARDWMKIDGIAGGKRLASDESGVWVETAVNAEAQLKRLVPGAPNWSVKTAVNGLVRWHAGPGGVLAVTRINGQQQELFVNDDGQTSRVILSVPPGPEERTIIGSRQFENQVWLRTVAGTLWNYRPATRRWTEWALDPQAAVDAVRFAGSRIWVREANGGLWVGQSDAGQPSGWQFTEAATGVRSFDVDAKLAVLATGTQIDVRDAQADANVRPIAVRDFSSRAWKDASDRLKLAAARDDALLAIAQSNAAAVYRLQTRQWDELPALPFSAIDLLATDADWLALGPKDELLRLKERRWEPVSLRSEKQWQQGSVTYSIDNQGRWGSGPAQQAAASPRAARMAAVTATPQRVLAGRDWLLVELTDGSLWRYDAARQELSHVTAAAAAGRPRTGLVSAGETAYLIANDLREAWRVADDTGLLAPIKLPESFAAQNWTALIHPDGLLLATDQAGVMLMQGQVSETLDATAVASRRAQSKSPDASRLLSADRWRISPASGQSPARLECRFEAEWKAAPVDFGRSRIGWDVATGGLSVTEQAVVLATAAGVAIRSTQQPGLPLQFLPIEWLGGVTPGGRIWALTADQCLVRAFDGRKWLLNLGGTGRAELTPLSRPPSQWSIEAEAQSLTLKAQFGKGTPVPVTIDRNGRLSCDVSTSVALADGSIWVATTAGIFEYSANLQELRDVQAFGPCEVLRASDLPSPVVRLADGQLRFRDGGQWKPSSGLWDQLLSDRALTNRPANSPLEWELDVGHDQPAVRKVRYVGQGLSIDQTVTPKGLATEASDGSQLFALTPDGLVIRRLNGEWVGHLPLPNAEGLSWIRSPGGGWELTAKGANDNGWRIEQNAAVPVENITALRQQRRLDWDGRSCVAERAEGGQRLVLRSGGEVADILDLKESGFLRDRILAFDWDGTTAWLVTPTSIERHSGSSPAVVAANSLTGRAQRIVRNGQRLLLTDGEQTLELRSDGSVGRATTQSGDQAALAALWYGANWRVARPPDATPGAVVEFRAKTNDWLPSILEPGIGFHWDQVQAIAAERDNLVIATRAGDFVVTGAATSRSLPLEDWRRVERSAASASDVLSGVELWTDAEGQLWKAHGGRWFRFRSGEFQWSPATELPANQQAERSLLSRTARAAWRQSEGTVQYIEYLAGGQPVSSVFSPDGVLSSGFVRAVLPLDKTLWLLTRQDLRQVDAASGQLLAVAAADASTVTHGEFRTQGAEWYLRWRRGDSSDVFRWTEKGWDRTNQTGPFAGEFAQVEAGLLRCRSTADGLSVELKASETSGEWHPVRFLPQANRFDFQAATNAVSDGTQLLVQTSVGVTAWRFAGNAPRFAALRPDLKFVGAPPASGRLLAGAEDNRWEELDLQGRWQATSLTEAESTVTARSSRWTVSRDSAGPARISVASQSDRPPTVLALDPRGDFEFRHVQSIAVASDGMVWTASRAALAQYRPQPPTAQAPVAVWANSGNPEKAVQDLFVADDAVHAEIGETLLRFDPDRGWQAVADRATVDAQRRILARGNLWTWTRTAGGQLVGQLQAGSQHRLSPQWDAAAGRFDIDQVQYGVPADDHVWFSHSAGLLQVSARNGQPEVFVPVAKAPRLVLDRRRPQWLAESPETPGRFARLEWDDANGTLKSPGDKPPLVEGRDDRYRDEEWHFTSEEIFWRGLRTWLIDQRFAHDHVQSLSRLSSQLVTSTPFGIIFWNWEAPRCSVAAIVPPPAANAEFLLDASEAGLLRAIDRTTQRVFEWPTPEGPWREPTAANPVRTLVKTPRWTWQQNHQRQLQLHMHAADRPLVEPVLNSDGRFAWDDVQSLLCAESSIWTGGRDGIVERSLADGEPVRWHRTGIAADEPRVLGSIVRLGRFLADGRPVMSWDRPEQVAAASLWALNDQQEAWQWDSQRQGGAWVHRSENPWLAPDGLRLLKHPLIETVQTAGNETALRYSQASTSIPVVQKGRLTIDSVRDLALTPEGDVMLATGAGVVLASRDSLAFERLWSDSTAPNALFEARQVYVDRAVGRLRARTQAGTLHEFEAATNQWQEVPTAVAPEDYGDAIVQTDRWTWSRWNDSVRVLIPGAGPAVGDWPLFYDGRFSFDVLRDFRLHGDRLVAATPGGVAWFDAESMQLVQIDRACRDADTGELVPLDSVQRFSGDESLGCFDETHVFRRNGDQWERAAGKERRGEHRFVAAHGHWQVQPAADAVAGGFVVLQFSDRGQQVTHRRVLPGVAESRLRRVVADRNGVWLCLDRGVYFVDGK